MRYLNLLVGGLTAAVVGAAMPALAQTQTSLNVRDASGAVVATCAFASGGSVYPCHLMFGADGSGALHVVLTDTSGRPIVTVSGTVQAAPLGATSNNASAAIATGGAFQTLLASNASRKGCTIENPTTATEPLFVSVGVATGSASVARAYSLSPGASFSCIAGALVVTDNIAVEAATTGHAFVETDQ